MTNNININMGYCKYRNTLKAIKELDELLDWDEDAIENMSKEELEAMKKIIHLAEQIVESSKESVEYLDLIC